MEKSKWVEKREIIPYAIDVKQISPEILSDIFNFKIKIFLSIYISHTIYTSLLYLCVVFKVKLRRMILLFYQNNVYHEIVYCSSLFFLKIITFFKFKHTKSLSRQWQYFLYIFLINFSIPQSSTHSFKNQSLSLLLCTRPSISRYLDGYVEFEVR